MARSSRVLTLWTARHDRLRALWQGVDPQVVCSVLGKIDASPDVRARIDEALARSGPDAAHALMPIVASAWESVERAERVEVLHALDALIRAGGDSTPALPTLGQALSDGRTVQAACAALRRAALFGWSIMPVREELARAATRDTSLRAVQRLEAMQRRGQHTDLRRLGTIYEQQVPMGTLHGGVGLVEELLLSDIDDEVAGARLALAELERAGSDLYRAWIALVPVLSAHLRGSQREHRIRAAAALAQVEVAIGRSSELTESEAAAAVLPHLLPALDGLTALLAGEEAERKLAATTIEVFVKIGCALGEARAPLEVALGDSQVEVRSACSRALSQALQRTGEETTLPPGLSHRRTYAQGDTPLADGRKTRCPSCQAMDAVLIYEARDRGNTWDDTTTERKCSSCQIYSVEHFGL